MGKVAQVDEPADKYCFRYRRSDVRPSERLPSTPQPHFLHGDHW